jgi:NAD(P)-dependent dehydrogenase (short-subunit alcohol dehydrogenase family)
MSGVIDAAAARAPVAGESAGRAIYPSLAGKRVFISGGGSGIGEGLVEAFVGQGARVVFCDIAVDQGEAVAARLAQGDAPAPLFLECDLRDSGAIAAVIAEAEAHLGGIDVVINNAGNDDRHSVEEVTPAYWDERMAVNLKHQFFVTQAAVPAMKRAAAR